MATNCCSTAARRLSDLLRDQQEPLLLHLLLQDHDDDSATPARRTPAAASAARRSLLRGSTATVTKLALRWADDVLAGCFSFPCGGACQRFRRLPCPDRDISSAGANCYDGGDRRAIDCGRQQFSPVSVLDLHSDDDSSAVPSQRYEHSDDDGNGKPSTSGTGTSPSPPSIHDLPGKIPATEERFQRKNVAFASAWNWEWERVAVDISRIPGLVGLDLSASPRDDWRRRLVVGGEQEARKVAQSIEAMILEEAAEMGPVGSWTTDRLVVHSWRLANSAGAATRTTDDNEMAATPARTPAAARRSLLRGSTAATVTKLALRWADDLLASCFSFPCAAKRQRFRRLPRPDRDISSAAGTDCYDGGGGGGAVDCGRQQLSPVSVLDLHSDDESSAVPSQRDEHSDDDGGNGKPLTSGTGTSPSPPSIHDHDHDLPGKIPATEERFQRKNVAFASAWDWEWERVAADISRIPSLVGLDLSASPRDDWRRRLVVGGEEEARKVAQSIEAMIFEEVRWEAVRDMLCSPQH